MRALSTQDVSAERRPIQRTAKGAIYTQDSPVIEELPGEFLESKIGMYHWCMKMGALVLAKSAEAEPQQDNAEG